MNTRIFLLFFCTLLFGLPSRSDTKHSISWLGNTFPGGSEQWVQNFVTEIAVTPDGTLYTSSEWDEAGRCVGAYKDGQANKQLFRQYDGRGGHNAWGWGTSSKAVTADDAHLYLINTDGELLRFRRADYGYKDQVSVGKALDMTHRDGVLYIVREGGSEVQLRKAQDLSLIRSFKADGAEDVAVDAKKRIWLRSGKQVRAFDANGNALPPVIKGLENPSDITVGSDGRLIVCENGTKCQIYFYDISSLDDAPKIVSKFGKLGGLRAGTPGMVKGDPHKLFTIRGAGTDAAGNLYVALGRNWTILRKFTPERNLVWEMESYTFVDGVSAAPGSDGKEIYGREEIFEFDYTKPAGQRAWTLKAITADFDRHPDDPRSTGKGTAWIRIVDGHRLLFVVDQLAGAMPVFCFDPVRNGQIALDSGLRKGQGWAVWPDARGNVWYAEGERIVMEPLTGFATDGKPVYGAAKTFKRPSSFRSVERIVYNPATDTIFLGGFTKDHPDPGGAWGLVGTEILRFDSWSKEPVLRTRIKLPFKTWNKGSTGEMIMPKSVDVAGDYVFVCYVSKSQTPGIIPPVRIYHSKTGKFMGELRPGGVAGGHHGYVDIAHGMSAFKRANGEYVVLVEEDNRAKIMLYRWTPPPPTTTTSTEQRARSSKSISRKR